MICVVLEHRSPNDVMDIVKELRAKGLVQGVDFDFAYVPPTEDWIRGVSTPKCTKFFFYNEKQATLFSLRYS